MLEKKRYSINNRRSDCLIREKLEAEAAEESTPKRQHKVFDGIQYLNSLANQLDLSSIRFPVLPDFRKDIEQFSRMHREALAQLPTAEEIRQSMKMHREALAQLPTAKEIRQSMRRHREALRSVE